MRHGGGLDNLARIALEILLAIAKRDRGRLTRVLSEIGARSMTRALTLLGREIWPFASRAPKGRLASEDRQAETRVDWLLDARTFATRFMTSLPAPRRALRDCYRAKVWRRILFCLF